MRIAVDARSAVGHGKTGVGYYTWYMVHLLPRVDPQTTYVIWYLHARGVLRLPGNRPIFGDIAAENVVEAKMPVPTRWFESLSRYSIPRVEWSARFDLLFAPNFVPPPNRARNLVLTVHDLAYKLLPHTAPPATRRWLSRLDAALDRASQIIVVSEQSRRDLLELHAVDPDHVTVVPLGVDTRVFRPASEEAVLAVRRRYGIEGPYLLSLGGIEPRKNLPAMIRAYAQLNDETRPALVVAGPGESSSPEGRNLLRSAINDLRPPVQERVTVTGYVSDLEKVALLTGADALVYPSLYEGFGLPLLEAMACGTPVLTSNVSALPETAGGSALLVDPHDTEAIVHGLERILTDSSLRQELRTSGLTRAGTFRWEDTARRTAKVLHLACGTPNCG